jgi:hypothetical protein
MSYKILYGTVLNLLLKFNRNMEIKDLRVDDAALRDGRVVIITGMSTYKIGADEVRVKDGF